MLLLTVWSEHPEGTARASIEFASMLVCTAIMARIVSVNAFIVGIVGGACAIVMAVMLTGGGGTGTALVGFLGSKNQVGSIAEVGAYCALLSWFIYRNILLRLLGSLVPLTVCMVGLYLSRSATSTVSFIAMLAASLGMSLIGKLPLRARAPVLFFAVIWIGTGAAAAGAYDWQGAGLEMAGKDSTLTGRTFLWREGLKTGMDNPILGVGYGAFWVPGTPEAEVLWQKFGITERRGFHFHNLVINEFVDLGVVGGTLWVLAYVVTGLRAIRYVRKTGSSIEFGLLCRHDDDVFGARRHGSGHARAVLLFRHVPFLCRHAGGNETARDHRGKTRPEKAAYPLLEPRFLTRAAG